MQPVSTASTQSAQEVAGILVATADWRTVPEIPHAGRMRERDSVLFAVGFEAKTDKH